MTQAKQSFFQTKHILKVFNHTHIALIPKGDNVAKANNFRPINLCNVIYKIISKILANKLRPLLPALISSCQLAVITGGHA